MLVAVASGSFMVIFDGAAVQMTLPVVQQKLGGTIQEVEWSMVAFLLLSTSTLLPFGRAGDVLGRERVYRAGILLFVVASALCASAPSLAWLVGARAIQGVGAAMTTANAAPILVDTFPEHSGRTGLLSSFFGYGSLFVALAALPYLLLVTQQRSIGASGLLVGVLPLVLSLTAPFAGAVTDRVGSRSICTASLLAMGAALVVILAGGSEVGTGRLLWAFALAGAGLGGFEAPNDVDVLRSLPTERMGAGTAFLGAVRNLGMTFGVAVGATLLDRAIAHGSGSVSERTAEGVQSALWIGAASASIGAATAMLRPRKASVAS